MQPIDTFIHGGSVLTMDRTRRELATGAIAIRDGEIVAVGDAAELWPIWGERAKETLDASGKLIMPGLVNSHTHLADILFRGLYDDLALEPWLERLWVSEQAFVRPDTVRLGSRLALAEMIRGGITSALDMFFFPEVSTEVAAETGFRLLAGQPLFSGAAPDGLDWPQRIERTRALFDHWQGHSLIVPWVMPHATYTVTTEHLAEVRDLVEELDAPFTTHLSETAFEVSTVAARCDHRQIDGIDHLRHQRHRAGLARNVFTQEDPTMAAGLIALSDDRIDAAFGKPACLLRRGGRADDDAARRFDPLQEAGGRQPEVKTHHLRLQLLDHVTHGGIEGCPVDGGHIGVGIQPFLDIERAKRLLPATIRSRIRRRRLVGEKVHVKRSSGSLADDADFGSGFVGVQHGAGKRAKPARLANGSGHGRSLGTSHG